MDSDLPDIDAVEDFKQMKMNDEMIVSLLFLMCETSLNPRLLIFHPSFRTKS